MEYKEIKEKFDVGMQKEDGVKIMVKVTDIINAIGIGFLEFNGSELSDYRSKLIGYKFYLSDFLSDLERISESIKIEVKEYRAKEYDIVAEEIKAKEGKVKNKEQIDNVILLKTVDKFYEQVCYQSMYHKYKMKISAIDDVLSAIMQRISELKKQQEDSKY